MKGRNYLVDINVDGKMIENECQPLWWKDRKCSKPQIYLTMPRMIALEYFVTNIKTRACKSVDWIDTI
jgi:hypothetical protein